MEWIVGGKGYGVDGIPLGDGMPNTCGHTVIGWVHHANFVVPAGCVLVGEDDGPQNKKGNGHHEEVKQWKEGAR